MIASEQTRHGRGHVSDDDLRQGLAQALRADRNHPVTITRFTRRPSPYQTSASLEEVDVELAGAAPLRLMFKQTGRHTMQPGAVAVKPVFLDDPRREIETYRQILAGAGLGTPHCYGAVADDRRGRYWLFLERVEGVELARCGAIGTWRRVGAWLAAAHAEFARRGAEARASHTHALRHDAPYYRRWLDRARQRVGHVRAPAADRRSLGWLAQRYGTVVDCLLSLPTTFIHGEFYASNVLVCERPAAWRICPVDWETAAVGPGLMDLAALVAGWPEGRRREIARAYHGALSSAGGPVIGFDQLLFGLNCCLIQFAIQWMGWFGSQPPPCEHARDWLDDALELAEATL